MKRVPVGPGRVLSATMLLVCATASGDIVNVKGPGLGPEIDPPGSIGSWAEDVPCTILGCCPSIALREEALVRGLSASPLRTGLVTLLELVAIPCRGIRKLEVREFSASLDDDDRSGALHVFESLHLDPGSVSVMTFETHGGHHAITANENFFVPTPLLDSKTVCWGLLVKVFTRTIYIEGRKPCQWEEVTPSEIVLEDATESGGEHGDRTHETGDRSDEPGDRPDEPGGRLEVVSSIVSSGSVSLSR